MKVETTAIPTIISIGYRHIVTMTNLVLHTHGATWTKNYHSFRLKCLIQQIAEMQSRGTAYFGINIECVLYMMYMVGYVRNGDLFEL